MTRRADIAAPEAAFMARAAEHLGIDPEREGILSLHPQGAGGCVTATRWARGYLTHGPSSAAAHLAQRFMQRGPGLYGGIHLAFGLFIMIVEDATP
jgi:hypothetical protein